ncbi:LysR family transcriptional regulator, partial [Streptomyces sp. NPDC001675]
GSYTRAWWGAQDWIPRATIEAEDDGAVLSFVNSSAGTSRPTAGRRTELRPLGPHLFQPLL